MTIHNCYYCGKPIPRQDEVPIPYIYEDGNNSVIYAHFDCLKKLETY